MQLTVSKSVSFFGNQPQLGWAFSLYCSTQEILIFSFISPNMTFFEVFYLPIFTPSFGVFDGPNAYK